MLSGCLNILVIVLSLLHVALVKAHDVEVLITGIRSDRGRIVIGVFEDEKSFKKDEPVIRLKFKKTDISNGQMKVKINLAPGTYGLALLDDENDDDVMTTNLIGYPKEGFGFSNYFHSSLTRPKFDAFKFVLRADQTQRVTIKIKYM